MAKKVDLPEPIIPNNSWKIVELGKYVKILNGYPFDSGRFTNSSENAFPLIRIRDVVRGYTETFTDEDCPEEYKIKKGEILIGMDGDFNIARWQSDFGLLNQRVCKIKSASKDLDDKFLYYYLPIPLKQINDATPSVTVKHLSSNSLLQLHFPLPPLTEQQRIVNRIETMFAKLDEAKDKAQSVVDSFETSKAAILHKAFTGQLTANWRKENGISDDSWEEKTVGECCSEVKVGIVIKPTRYYTEEEMGIPAFRSANVRENHIDDFDWVYINAEGMKNEKRSIVHTNDVLVVRSGAPGTACVVTEQFDGYNAIDILIAVPLQVVINSYFLCYYTNSPMGKNIVAEKKRGLGLTHFNVKGYSATPIRIPSLIEQKEIVRILDTVLEKENYSKEAAQTVLDQIALLKKSILARAFRGEL